MKKIIAMVLALVLVAGVSIAGTVAYLTSTKANHNTMVVGNVDIAQWEYEREKDANGNYTTIQQDGVNSYKLVGFTQDKMLLPATETNANGTPNNFGAGGWDPITVRMTQVGSHGGMQMFTSPNALDKFVVVENTGNTEAYVRTLVAIEVGSGNANLIHIGCRGTDDAAVAGEDMPWFRNAVGTVSIGGVNYFVYEFVYEGAKTSSGYKHADGVLPVGATTYPSLAQVYVDATATNDDVKALAGENGRVDILVLSQAVQAGTWTVPAGVDKTVAQYALDVALGEATAENVADWFEAIA